MSTNIFESLVEYASRNYYEKYAFNHEEYIDVRNELLKLQQQYSDMNLTIEQRHVLDSLLKTHAELCESCMEKVYEQGLRDCVTLLQELHLL